MSSYISACSRILAKIRSVHLVSKDGDNMSARHIVAAFPTKSAGSASLKTESLVSLNRQRQFRNSEPADERARSKAFEQNRAPKIFENGRILKKYASDFVKIIELADSSTAVEIFRNEGSAVLGVLHTLTYGDPSFWLKVAKVIEKNLKFFTMTNPSSPSNLKQSVLPQLSFNPQDANTPINSERVDNFRHTPFSSLNYVSLGLELCVRGTTLRRAQTDLLDGLVRTMSSIEPPRERTAIKQEGLMERFSSSEDQMPHLQHTPQEQATKRLRNLCDTDFYGVSSGLFRLAPWHRQLERSDGEGLLSFIHEFISVAAERSPRLPAEYISWAGIAAFRLHHIFSYEVRLRRDSGETNRLKREMRGQHESLEKLCCSLVQKVCDVSVKASSFDSLVLGRILLCLTSFEDLRAHGASAAGLQETRRKTEWSLWSLLSGPLYTPIIGMLKDSSPSSLASLLKAVTVGLKHSKNLASFKRDRDAQRKLGDFLGTSVVALNVARFSSFSSRDLGTFAISFASFWLAIPIYIRKRVRSLRESERHAHYVGPCDPIENLIEGICPPESCEPSESWTPQLAIDEREENDSYCGTHIDLNCVIAVLHAASLMSLQSDGVRRLTRIFSAASVGRTERSDNLTECANGHKTPQFVADTIQGDYDISEAITSLSPQRLTQIFAACSKLDVPMSKKYIQVLRSTVLHRLADFDIYSLASFSFASSNIRYNDAEFLYAIIDVMTGRTASQTSVCVNARRGAKFDVGVKRQLNLALYTLYWFGIGRTGSQQAFGRDRKPISPCHTNGMRDKHRSSVLRLHNIVYFADMTPTKRDPHTELNIREVIGTVSKLAGRNEGDSADRTLMNINSLIRSPAKKNFLEKRGGNKAGPYQIDIVLHNSPFEHHRNVTVG